MIEIFTELTEQTIDADWLTSFVKSDEAGAVVSFSGDVRNHDHERDVASLTYEVHPSAQLALAEIVHDVCSGSTATAVAVSHRHGEIPIGESAFVVVVASAHRGAAFELCAKLVDEVKLRLPIWKHQVFTDGTDEWVNCA
jgi:molybdopterin synthase catalytic subunit